MGDVDTDTVDTDTVDTTVTLTEVTDTDTTWARGPLMPNPRLMLKPLSCTPATLDMDTDTVLVPIVDMVLVDTTAMPDTDTVLVPTDTVDTLMPPITVTTWARGPLMPNPRLMLMPLLTHGTDTTDVDTDTVDTDTVDTTAVDTTVTPDTDTVTAVTTVRKFATCYFLPFFLN